MVNEILAVLALIFIAVRGGRNGVLFPRPRKARAIVIDDETSPEIDE